MNIWKESSTRAQLVAAGLLLVLAVSLAVTDLSGDQKLMVLIGALLVMTGNAMPKALRPLATMRCETTMEQAVRRGTAWFLVVVGMAWIISWLAFASELATSITIGTSVLTGVVIVGVLTWCRVARSRGRPPVEI